jgi:hypothetical protein
MGSNELRYFFDSEKSLFHSNKPEKRTDYYIVANEDVGLKFRSGKGLEMKIRKKVLDFGVETWEKYLINGDINLNNVTVELLVQTLKDFSYEKEKVNTALEKIKNIGINIISVEKERIQSMDYKTRICCETTKLTLSQQHNPDLTLICYTYCSEGSSPKNLSQQSESDLKSSITTLLPMGYPEFILKYYNQTLTLNK